MYSSADESTSSPVINDKILQEIYDEFSPDLLRYVMRLVNGDRYLAEDIVQETILRCWEKQPLQGGRGIRPWLFTVAKNLVIDGYRKRNARPQEMEITDSTEWISSTDSDEMRSLTSVLILEAFKKLSQAHREVLYETFFMGRSITEASMALGVPVGTIKSRTYYALRALRLKIGETDS